MLLIENIGKNYFCFVYRTAKEKNHYLKILTSGLVLKITIDPIDNIQFTNSSKYSFLRGLDSS